MRAFTAPKVQSARNCCIEEPGGSTLIAATGQLHGLCIKLRIAQQALGN